MSIRSDFSCPPQFYDDWFMEDVVSMMKMLERQANKAQGKTTLREPSEEELRIMQKADNK